MLLFCPHCDKLEEILGLPRKPAPLCDCGGLLEPIADDNTDDNTDDNGDGIVIEINTARGHPETARRLTANFHRLFPVSP